MRLEAAKKEELTYIKALYKQAFPKIERKPLWLLYGKQKTGIAEILSIKDENENMCGLAITLIYKDMVLLDYFAIDENARGNGLGSEAIQLIKQRYETKRLLLEIETPNEQASNNEQRVRRKQFYHKNGLVDTNIFVNIYHLDMELLTDGSYVTFDDYITIYQKTMGKMITNVIRIKNVK